MRKNKWLWLLVKGRRLIRGFIACLFGFLGLVLIICLVEYGTTIKAFLSQAWFHIITNSFLIVLLCLSCEYSIEQRVKEKNLEVTKRVKIIIAKEGLILLACILALIIISLLDNYFKWPDSDTDNVPILPATIVFSYISRFIVKFIIWAIKILKEFI